MLSREDLYFRLLYLVPNAKFSFWPKDGSDDDGSKKGVEFVIVIDNWCIDWDKSNLNSCPTEQEIKNVDVLKMQQKLQLKIKQQRNTEKANDLSLVASFNIEKKTNPTLEFSDYVDQLETDSAAIKNAEATPIGDV